MKGGKDMKGKEMLGAAEQPTPEAKQGVLDKRYYNILLALYLNMRDLINNQLYLFSDEERKKLGDRLAFIKKTLREIEEAE